MKKKCSLNKTKRKKGGENTDEGVKYDRNKPCPPGYYRKSNGNCGLITHDEQEDEIYIEPKKRCKKGTRKNKLGECVASNIAKMPKSIKIIKKVSETAVSIEDVTEQTKNLLKYNTVIKVQKPTIMYLFNFINNYTPDELRKRNEDKNLLLPFENYHNDKDLLIYLFNEIMEMSINRTRDSKKKLVSIKIIQEVIKNDSQLKELFD